MFNTTYVQVSNKEFIEAIFGEDSYWCHVTDFTYDPGNIPKDRHLIAWKGDYYCRYQFEQNSNQYFTISTFYCDDEQQARRRKALFKQTPCIVLDDVKEKLSMDEVNKLPQPAWILETSTGSEQWGYILDTPCTDRSMVENLLDGLVANGLAPDGKDPGMKGVTRYVRLPEGINNKASKLLNGQPFKCRMSLWEPTRRVTIEQLATPFCVDLHAVRREARVDGAAAVSDHPLINIPEIIHIKEVRSDGRFDITCPWVNDHTGQDDSGSAVFTNADGSIGFKCHHGNCQERTGADLIRYIDGHSEGFSSKLKNWQVMRELASVAEYATPPVASVQEVSFLGAPTVDTSVVEIQEPAQQESLEPDAIQLLCDQLRRQVPGTTEQRNLASKVLKHVDNLPKIDQRHWHDVIVDIMRWSKADFKDIILDLRKIWYGDKISQAEFYDNVVFVKELNQFYAWDSRIFFSTEAFQNSFSHEDSEARKIALQDGRVKKVDRLDYAPKKPNIFEEGGVVYGNTWTESSQSKGEPGEVSRWLEHFDKLGWQEHRDHISKWMAFTLRYPDRKINHMLLLGSGEGCGKDFLLYPLICAMGDNSTTIDGEELKGQFNDYLLATKYLHINEAELGDHNDAKAISNRLKPLAAAPPEKLRVNQKGVKPIKVRNIVNSTMTTNSVMPLRLNGASRRFFAVWSDMNPRDKDDNMEESWLEYWKDRWTWMKGDGWKAVVHYLMNDVDLSTFNPDQAPPMTDFLRDIKEASKSPMQQTLESFIRNQHGSFRCDILSAQDMGETLRAGSLAPGDMMSDPRYFTDKKIGMLLKEIGGFQQVRCTDVRLWIIRNEEKYESMTLPEIRQEYERQIRDARGDIQLTIVK
ncbi:coil containing protein [Vibrio phage MZH0603]|nr:coil containing protein [Vibrio phage MZH0603]